MRLCSEIRQDAWNILTGSKWGWKILLNGVLLCAIMIAVLFGLEYLFEVAGIQTWESFREAQLAAKRSGVDLAVASGHEALRMTFASGFSMFVQYIFQGIISFGMCVTLLKCIKNDSQGWFFGAFGGFARPLEMFWLTMLMMVKIVLWALLLIIPGIIACFRYALAWYVKAENPEMSANACIKRSSELMDGRKWNFVILGLSYFGWFLLAVLPIIVASGIMGASRAGLQAGEEVSPDIVSLLVVCGSIFVSVVMFAFVSVYVAIGKAVFYRDAKAESGTEPQAVKA
ncbi:MAG: DUF975 family protein [Kiritimatiellae bacterium]|nr:DUF975 family protein [Kiritimatiellia bacterium]